VVTIHSSHPFRDPEADPVRRLRGRLGGAVTLWTAGEGEDVFEWAGLTVTSVLVAVLTWDDRDLADAFAGTAPAPGGPFRQAEFTSGPWGPRLTRAATWAGVRLESATPVGWSSLVTCVVEEVTVGEDDPLIHRRGRYLRPLDGSPD
jgi:hypothetical protein